MSWECASDIPLECMSNMDDIAMNAHNHHKKLIVNKLNLGRLFQEANAGDNEMPIKISLRITSKPCGK